MSPSSLQLNQQKFTVGTGGRTLFGVQHVVSSPTSGMLQHPFVFSSATLSSERYVSVATLADLQDLPVNLLRGFEAPELAQLAQPGDTVRISTLVPEWGALGWPHAIALEVAGSPRIGFVTFRGVPLPSAPDLPLAWRLERSGAVLAQGTTGKVTREHENAPDARWRASDFFRIFTRATAALQHLEAVRQGVENLARQAAQSEARYLSAPNPVVTEIEL